MPLPDPPTLVHAMLDQGASDLHLKVGVPPMVRVHGDMTPMPGMQPLSAEDTRAFAAQCLNRRLKVIGLVD